MIRAGLTRWLQGPPLTGRNALLCVIAAVAIPTIIRAAVSGVVTGCEFTPYLPFVFLSAILLRWWKAAAVALASVAILGGLFAGPHQAAACFIPSAGIFLASSAAMIGMVGADQGRDRRHPEPRRRRALGRDRLQPGEWRGLGELVRRRPAVAPRLAARVSRMMKDFLNQEEVGKRLNRRP